MCIACNEPIKVFEEIRANHIAGFSKKFGCVSCTQTSWLACKTPMWLAPYKEKEIVGVIHNSLHKVLNWLKVEGEG